jgi:hypothetical protein
LLKALGAAVVRVRFDFGIFLWQVQQPQNHFDHALPSKDAGVGEEQEAGGLRVIGEVVGLLVKFDS